MRSRKSRRRYIFLNIIFIIEIYYFINKIIVLNNFYINNIFIVKDDTYMYDEEARCGDMQTLEVVGGGIQHWYDEPPYESDPEDFLMGSIGAKADTTSFDNSRYSND